MTRTRAKYLLANRLLGGAFRRAYRAIGDSPDSILQDDGITPDEHQDVLDVWLTMDGWTSYTDAVIRIAKEGSDGEDARPDS